MENLPKEPTHEELDALIAGRLETLYAEFEHLAPWEGELSDEWYWAEQALRISFNKQNALRNLEEFIAKLKAMKEKGQL